MTLARREQVAKEIAALAHGKALFALTPVLEAVAPDKREKVYRFVASEYDGFAEAINRLLVPKAMARRYRPARSGGQATPGEPPARAAARQHPRPGEAERIDIITGGDGR